MIRVIIERHVKKDKQGDLMPLLRELRAAAMHQPGYVTGETLANTKDASTIATLSTWRSLEDWKVWEKSGLRKKLYRQIEPLLAEKAKMSIYEVMATEKR